MDLIVTSIVHQSVRTLNVTNKMAIVSTVQLDIKEIFVTTVCMDILRRIIWQCIYSKIVIVFNLYIILLKYISFISNVKHVIATISDPTVRTIAHQIVNTLYVTARMATAAGALQDFMESFVLSVSK